MPARNLGKVEILEGSVKIIETKSDQIWKWISRLFQLVSVIIAAVSIYVLIVIQKEVNQITQRTKQVDRSLELTGNLNKITEDRLIIERLFFKADKFLNESPEDATAEETLALLHKFINERMNDKDDKDILEKALHNSLSAMSAIKSCVSTENPLCDLETVLSSLNEKIISYYIYLKPVIYCNDFFKKEKFSDDLEYLAVRYADWSPDYVLADIPNGYDAMFKDEDNLDSAKKINISEDYDCKIAERYDKRINEEASLFNRFIKGSLWKEITTRPELSD